MSKIRSLVPGSVAHQVSLMNVGEVKWVETTAKRYAYTERKWGLSGCRPQALKGYDMTCAVFTAIGHSVGSPPVILVRVQRMK